MDRQQTQGIWILVPRRLAPSLSRSKARRGGRHPPLHPMNRSARTQSASRAWRVSTSIDRSAGHDHLLAH